MAEEFKKTGLMDGMGENDEIERWITVKGNHIPITGFRRSGKNARNEEKRAYGRLGRA